MNLYQLRQRRLSLLSSVSLLLLFPSFLLGLVNLELGLRVLVPGWVVLERIVPAGLFASMAFFSADLSSISTLVPVLLFLFPFFIARRILRHREGEEDALRQLVYDPYPPHFPFFLVMLGLVGTLYGLLIGLDTSGVSQLGTQAPTPEQIQETLDRLLGGTATALLSSLLGLVGAFLAARPLTWVFYWAACIPAEDDRVSLSETLHQLTSDLRQLGEASRSFGERLHLTEVESIPATLRDVRDALQGIQQSLAAQHDEAIQRGQAANQALLQSLEQARESHAAQLRTAEAAEQLAVSVRGAVEQAEGDRRASADHRSAILAALDEARSQRSSVLSILEMERDDRRRERGSVRRAFAQLADLHDATP